MRGRTVKSMVLSAKRVIGQINRHIARLWGGLRLGAAAGEGFAGLSGTYTGVVCPVHAGVTFLSHYDPQERVATTVREVYAEVGAGIQWPSSVMWRGSIRGVMEWYSIGLGLEAGAIIRRASGTENVTPYIALLFQLPTAVFPH